MRHLRTLPGFAVAQYRIENYNELPHDGSDYILEGIALATQTIGKCFQNGIGSHSDAGCHIERTAYGCATGFYVACPPLLTAVIVDRCQSCKPCGLTLCELTDVRQIGKHDHRRNRTDADDGLHQRDLLPQHLAPLDKLSDVSLDCSEGSLQRCDMGFEALQHALVLGVIKATGLGDEHLLDLRPAGMERTQCGCIRWGRRIEPNVFCLETILPNQARIDRIGLGKQTAVVAKVAYARAMCPVDGKIHLEGYIENMALIAACGFANNKHPAELFFAIALDLGLD